MYPDDCDSIKARICRRRMGREREVRTDYQVDDLPNASHPAIPYMSVLSLSEGCGKTCKAFPPDNQR